MKIIKSVREIFKEFVDACHGFIDNSSQYKEYDNKGNLVHINTYNSNCINWDEMSSTDDYAEDDVINKYDDLGRLVERITKQKGLSLIEKYTYNDKGQELSYTRIKENDYKYRLDFSYETDEKDRLWKRGSVGGGNASLRGIR